MSSKFHILSSVFLGPPFNHSFSLENHLPQPESCFSGNGRPILSKKCFKQPSRHYIFFMVKKKLPTTLGCLGAFFSFGWFSLQSSWGRLAKKSQRLQRRPTRNWWNDMGNVSLYTSGKLWKRCRANTREQ